MSLASWGRSLMTKTEFCKFDLMKAIILGEKMKNNGFFRFLLEKYENFAICEKELFLY